MKDEFSFIASITPKKTVQRSLLKGIGDDAAVYRSLAGMDEVVCVDTVVENIHFRRSTSSPYFIGRKALASNLSDLAAMGAQPSFYLVSIVVPATWTEDEIKAIFAGMASLASEYDVDLIGGDTVSTSADALVLTVTVIGRVEQMRALYRGNAKPGDVIFLTGAVGASAAGLKLLQEKGQNGAFSKEELDLVRAHQDPQPHVQQGRLLAKSGFRIATNDISDGVASEAHEIAEASRVLLILEEEALPLHDGMASFSKEERLHMALYGGEDYVIMGTVAINDVESLKNTFAENELPFFTIGRVEAGEPGVLLKRGDRMQKIKKEGYNHFRSR